MSAAFEDILTSIQKHRVRYDFLGPWCSCGWKGIRDKSGPPFEQGKADQVEGDRHLAAAIDDES